MATKTARFYSNSDGSTADLVYDDVAMTSSGVLVHLPVGAKPVTATAVINGTPVSVTYQPGTDITFSFGSALPITFVTTKSGGQGISMPWFGSVGFSVGG